MSSNMMQAIIWLLAGVVLVTLMMRRRNRKASR